MFSCNAILFCEHPEIVEEFIVEYDDFFMLVKSDEYSNYIRLFLTFKRKYSHGSSTYQCCIDKSLYDNK